jgi:hypothetical protein
VDFGALVRELNQLKFGALSSRAFAALARFAIFMLRAALCSAVVKFAIMGVPFAAGISLISIKKTAVKIKRRNDQDSNRDFSTCPTRRVRNFHSSEGHLGQRRSASDGLGTTAAAAAAHATSFYTDHSGQIKR